MPLIVEATLWGTRHDEKKDPEALQHVCRMAYELGADAIKTEYTGDVERCAQVIDSVACRCSPWAVREGAADAT